MTSCLPGAWLVWMFLIPLIVWANGAPPRLLHVKQTNNAQVNRVHGGHFLFLIPPAHLRVRRARMGRGVHCTRRQADDIELTATHELLNPRNLVVSCLVRPACVKRWWYEVCYYTHYLGAWVTVLMALYARFEVFFPVAIGPSRRKVKREPGPGDFLDQVGSSTRTGGPHGGASYAQMSSRNRICRRS